MNKLAYKASDIIDLSFGLNIEGTNHKPTEVAIKVCYNKQNYGVIAEYFDEEYHAKFNLANIPNLNIESKLDFSIEVTLNGRIFKPFKRQLTIVDYEDVQAKETNHEIEHEIEHKEIKEEKIKPEVINNSTPFTIPTWAKDILNGTSIPQDLETQFKKVEQAVEKKKLTIKFDKPKPVKKQPVKEELSGINTQQLDIKFNDTKIKKKPIKKKEKKENFVITEGKILYL
jgi:hypothetical protein